MDQSRAINWIESTCRSMQASVPEVAENAFFVTERLAVLFLERLPQEVAAEMLSLLPEDSALMPRLRARPVIFPDTSIGFTDFVELTRYLLGLSDLLDQPKYAESEPEYADLCQKVAEAFLWAIAQELPPDLKSRLSHHMPGDLRCRMNLYSGYSSEEHVA